MKDKFLVECSCGGYHYLQIENWDSEFIVAFIQEPTTLWETLKRWWKHQDDYLTDAVLTREQMLELKKFLDERLLNESK